MARKGGFRFDWLCVFTMLRQAGVRSFPFLSLLDYPCRVADEKFTESGFAEDEGKLQGRYFLAGFFSEWLKV